MLVPKHMPYHQWPEADRRLFEAAFVTGDIFDEYQAPGAHLSAATRTAIQNAYGRWLAFLLAEDADLLASQPPSRLSRAIVRRFVETLSAEVRLTTVAHSILNLHYAVRLMEPASDWKWISAIGNRIAARSVPIDRLPRLIPPHRTLDLGINLMDSAVGPSGGKKPRAQENQYRDGLLIALLSVWPIRRRSVTALTTGHVVASAQGYDIFLEAEDTKEKRSESATVPTELVPYIADYLKFIRPRIVGKQVHEGFWPSRKGGALRGQRLYQIIRDAFFVEFGKRMGLHDLRRAAATFLAFDDPDLIGLIPGILSHTDSRIGEKHYNLANSAAASRRYNTALSELKSKLGR